MLLAYPDAVVRVQRAGRLPHDRHDGARADGDFPAPWRLVVPALGVLPVLAGLYFGATAFS